MKHKGLAKISILGVVIALLAGIQLPLALAPFNISLLAFLSPALLLALWLHASPRGAFLYGLLYGLSAFGFGASWVFISVHTYGNAGILLAGLITTLLILTLALFIAVNGYCLNKLWRRPTIGKIIIAFPLSWVIFEWLRSWLFTGFPWLLLGYSQLGTPLQSYAPLLSVYGVSLIVALNAAALVLLFYRRSLASIITAILVLVLTWTLGLTLNDTSWTKPIGKPIRVALIQGNIAQTIKWQPEATTDILKTYLTASQNNWSKQLIVWPEAAIPVTNITAQNFITDLARLARKHNSTIISGIPYQNETTGKFYNAMLAFGMNNSRYFKRHLVPFGEYQPMASITKIFMQQFNIPMSTFSAGTNKQPQFEAANISIAPFICYEIAYPFEALTYLPQAQLLVTISDDSWFGRSIAAAQHLQIAQMRSLETGRYQIIATNTGVTAIINSRGQIVAQAPQYKFFVLKGRVQPMQGSTPWIRIGHYLEL